jgi:hypothetical protein
MVLPVIPVVAQRQRIAARSVEHAVAAPAQAIAHDPLLLVLSSHAAGGTQQCSPAGAPGDVDLVGVTHRE